MIKLATKKYSVLKADLIAHTERVASNCHEKAEAALKRWISWARRSQLEPIKKLGTTLKERLAGVVRGMLDGRSNAYVEAMNGMLQQTKRAARGFRTVKNFAAIAYLRMSKLKHLPHRTRYARPRRQHKALPATDPGVKFHSKRHRANSNGAAVSCATCVKLNCFVSNSIVCSTINTVRPRRLFHRHRFGQVTRFVDIGAACQRRVVGQQLQRYHVQNR